MTIISKNKNKSLLNTLSFLKENTSDFQEVAMELFLYNYEDFNSIFKIDQETVPAGSYKRVPIFTDKNCSAILMLWGSNNQTAIHDHLNYEGLIKVLKGTLREISYYETEYFIEYEKEGDASEGVIFSEDFGGIHSVVNNSAHLAVSLHIYHTPQTSLQGVRIFDIEKRKVAYLNEKATSCSWNLPSESYEKVIYV